MKTIVLFTNSYPYSIRGEYTFIEPELKVLNKYFKIILVPLSKETNISRSLIKDLKNVSVVNIEFNKYKEIFNLINVNHFIIKEVKNVKQKSHMKDLFITYIKMKWIEKFIEKKLKSGEWSKNYIYYTYWFNFATSALVNLKENYNLKIITRAHRYDLYEEERRGGYIPFRKRDVKKLDKIVTISLHGFCYLKNKYQLENLYNSYLGIEGFNIESPTNHSNDTIKIVSCALMSPVKRIDLTVEFLSKIANELDVKIKWDHIGDGILKEKLNQIKEKFKHKNFSPNFVGYLENKKIFEYYKNNPFDFFITLSASEGLPVSLMEACRAGLPIIATNVGGISEIVNDGVNGILLSSSPSYEEFKEKFKIALEYKKDNNKFNQLRQNSRKIFLEKFNASNNYEKFAEFIDKL